MCGSYNSKEEVESAFLEGNLDLFGLERIADEHPDYVSNDLWAAAYNGFIKENRDECFEDFNRGDFDAGMQGIINMNYAIKDALRLGYCIDTTDFKNTIEQAYESARYDFNDNLTLFKLLENSPLDFSTWKNDIQSKILPALAEGYSKEILKKSKRVAKRFKRTEKHPNYAIQLNRHIGLLEEPMKYGAHPDKEIAEIKRIAFHKGVEFYLNKAKRINSCNSEKAAHLRNVAKQNAEVLGMNEVFNAILPATSSNLNL